MDYQAVIVGSGYGGAVAALRLAERGVKTLVLEKGRDWSVSDPTRDATFATLEAVTAGEPSTSKSTWLNQRCVGNLYLHQAGGMPCTPTTGILEMIDDVPATHRDASPLLRMTGMNAIVATGVGGGSLVNNGVTFAPNEAGWNAAYPARELPWMRQIWQELRQVYFETAFGMLAPSPPPPDVLASRYYRGTQLMLEYATAAGYPLERASDPATLTFGQALAPVIVDWDKVRQELAGTRVRSVVLGEAWWGNNSGARRSLNTEQSYLGRALATGHVTIKALHTVGAIHHDPRRNLYALTVTHTDADYNTLETLTITTPHLILSAGSLGTTKLLVRARERGDLPHLNEHVGTRFSTNGNTGHLRINPAEPEPVGQGGLAGIKINDYRQPDNPVVLENLPQRMLPGTGPHAALQTAILTVGIGIPTATANFRYDRTSDTVVLDWPVDGARNVYDRVTELYRNLPGGMFFQLPLEQAQANTLHPLGGAPIGLATNRYGKLKGYKHLYALDGSLLPNGSAVTNPSLLITALAERCMSKIADSIAAGRDDWEDPRFDDAE